MIKYFMACYFIQSVKMMNRELLAFDELPINMKKKSMDYKQFDFNSVCKVFIYTLEMIKKY